MPFLLIGLSITTIVVDVDLGFDFGVAFAIPHYSIYSIAVKYHIK